MPDRPFDDYPDDLDGEATQVSMPPSERGAPMPPLVHPQAAQPPPPSSPHRMVPPTPRLRPSQHPHAPPQGQPPQGQPPEGQPGQGGYGAAAPGFGLPAQPSQPSPFATPEAPGPLAPRGSFAPEGLVKRTPNAGFNKGFTGTIMGTMVFIAQSRSVGLSAKIGGVVLLVAAVAAGTVLYVQQRNREQAEADLRTAMARPHDEGVPRVRELIGAGLGDESTAVALRFLGQHRDAEAVPLFIEALSGTNEVQRAAADGLAEVGPPAAAPAASALAELLTGEDVTLRMHAAWALARLGDARGLDEIISALAEGTAPSLSSYDPHTLADLMDREGLLSAIAHESATVRQFAARHLGDVCTPADEGPLARAAGDTDPGVAEAAMVSLARCGMPGAQASVASAFASGHERWNTLYAHMRGDAGVRGLGLLLPHAPNETTKRSLMQEIALSLDPRAADVLLAELERLESPSARDRLDVGVALAFASHPRLVEVLEPVIAGGEPDHAQAAIALLGQTSTPESVEARLLPLLRDSTLRGSAIDAMAEAGVCSDAAQSALARLLGQRALRTKTLRALGRCGHTRALEAATSEVTSPLATPITVEAGELRLAALDVVTAREVASVVPALFEQLSEPATDPRIRMAIADALAVLAPEGLRDQVLDRLLDPQRPIAVRAAMMRVLASGIAPASMPRLLGFVRGGADDERTRNAAVLLGLAPPRAHRDELVTLLSDERASRHAALTLALGADPASANALTRRVRAEDALSGQLATDLRTSPWTFALGREAQLREHIRSVMAVRDAGYAHPASRLCEALSDPPSGLHVHTRATLARGLLHELTEGVDAPTRTLAAEALDCMGARSAVLSVRDARGPGAQEARRALADVRRAAPEPAPAAP